MSRKGAVIQFAVGAPFIVAAIQLSQGEPDWEAIIGIAFASGLIILVVGVVAIYDRLFHPAQAETAPAPAPPDQLLLRSPTGAQVGPMLFEDVARRWRSGEITSDWEVTSTAHTDWQPLSQFESALAD